MTEVGFFSSARHEFIAIPCRTLITLYGAATKKQRKNYRAIPAGTEGIARQRVTEGEAEVVYFLCVFVVDGQRLWTRCAPTTIELRRSRG